MRFIFPDAIALRPPGVLSLSKSRSDLRISCSDGQSPHFPGGAYIDGNAYMMTGDLLYSTKRSSGPGLYILDAEYRSLPAAGSVIAGGYIDPEQKTLLLGPNCNERVYASEDRGEAGGYSTSMGSKAGIVSQRSSYIGSNTFPNQLTNASSPKYPTRIISLGYNTFSGLTPKDGGVSAFYKFNTNDCIGIGSNAVGPPRSSLAGKVNGLSNAVVIGNNSLRGVTNWIYQDSDHSTTYPTRFTLVGNNTVSTIEEVAYGFATIIGSDCYNQYKPSTLNFRAGIDNITLVAQNFGYSVETYSRSQGVNIATLATPGSRSVINDNAFNAATTGALVTAASSMELPFARMDPRSPYYTELYAGGNRVAVIYMFGNSKPPYDNTTMFTNSEYSTGVGPYVSTGPNSPFVQGRGASEKGLVLASGSFQGPSGETYTVTNGLITSIA